MRQPDRRWGKELYGKLQQCKKQTTGSANCNTARKISLLLYFAQHIGYDPGDNAKKFGKIERFTEYGVLFAVKTGK